MYWGNVPAFVVTYANPENQRAAARRHYAKNRTAMKDRALVFKTAARIRNREYVLAVKRGSSCVDCGFLYPPHVLQFDHLTDDKDRSVADLVNAAVSLKRLQEEIDKCELVCANCHAVRTYERLTTE